MDPLIEADSDNEDDPTKLLNQWLGELNSLKKGLDSKSSEQEPGGIPGPAPRNQFKDLDLAEQKKKYRCSLINLDTSQDEELDAILGELTVLESQFDQELVIDQQKKDTAAALNSPAVNGGNGVTKTAERSPVSPAESDRSSSNITDLGIHSNTHSRSSSGSDEMKHTGQLIRRGGEGGSGGGRTESPDTDSAFCDNLSVLSSCSAASSSKTGQSIGVPSSVLHLTKEQQDAKIKAEKIKLAIEKIKEASVKKLFIKVFTSDGSAKSLLVDEKMSVAHVTRILAEKNHVQLDPKWALVELVPDLYMERVYEDHEQLVDNCLLWKVDSKNTLWFIERPEKFDLFLRPEVYLLGTSSSQKDDQMEEHSRQELLEEYFSSSGVGAPQLEGNIYLKADSKKSWKKFYFVLRTSGLYYAPKGKKSSKDLVCLTTFDVNQVYYGVGWKNKYKAPTDFCFGIKHPQIQAKNPKYIKYLCVESQRELHQWVTGIRIAKNGKSLYENYRGIVEEITHADIDILTSKRFSVNSTNGLQIAASNNKEKAENGIQSPARTPSSENKSLASALSSGFESDLSNGSSKQDVSKLNQSVDTDEGCSGSGNDSTEKISAGLTPVGTLERSFKLRRSFSRSSRSSSGSGCMSDKSGAELGFESDFPLGGTIKKRPTTTPRLPLTNTTWGLVKESDQENDEEDMMAGTGMGGGVVGVGAGGTLLRRAVRNSVRKPKENGVDNIDYSSSANASPQHQPSPTPSRLTEVSSTITLTAIDDPLSQAFERSLSSMSEDGELPLPPPPRMDSISSLDQIDQLPPPPADMVYNTAAVGDASSHYHVSPVSSPLHAPKVSLTGLPPAGPGAYAKFPGSPKLALPPAVKKPVLVQKSSRRISFDDNVQMIEAPSSPVTQEQMYLPGQNLKEKAYAKFTPAPPYRGNPKKLVMFNEDPATNTNSLPRRFINDLQRVMNKKWQVAEKCRSDRDTTPHEVLGFRDEQVKNLGQQGLYSQKSAIGAWVLDSQQYTPEELEVPEYQGAQQAAPYQDPYSGNKTYTPDRSLAAGHRQDSSPSQFQHSRQESPSHNIYGRQESPIQHHVGRQESPGSPYHQQLNQHQESPSHYSALHHHHTQQQQQHRQESPYAGFPNQLQQNSHHQQHQLMMAGHSPQSPQHHIVHHHMHHASPQGHHPHNSHHASPVHHGLPLGGVQSPHHHFHHGPVAGLPPPHSPQHNGAYGMNGGSGSHSPASSGSGGGSSHGSGSQQPKPVVLIEPEPNYVDPSRMRANKGAKRPPPPPRRNDNTQLTAAGY